MGQNILIEWTDKLSVGVQEIDSQHKQLVDIINNLYDALQNGKAGIMISETLDKLLLYTKYHFKAEEALMKEFDFQNFQNHRNLHRQFKEQLTIIITDLKDGNSEVYHDTLQLLSTWLTEHIMVKDKEFFSNIDLD